MTRRAKRQSNPLPVFANFVLFVVKIDFERKK